MPDIRRVSAATLIVLLVVVLALVAPACSKKKAAKESVINKIPTQKELPVVRMKDHPEANVTGAWLRNWCAAQYMNLMRQAQGGGVPMEIDEHSLIEAGRLLLTKLAVLSMEAQRRGLSVSDEDVQAQLSKEMAAFDSTEAWRKQLEASGMDVDERKRQIRVELLSNKLRDEVVRPSVQRLATPERARAFYDRFPDGFRYPRTLHLLHLLRSVARDAPADERTRERGIIDAAHDRVAKGEKFEDVAREISTDVSAIKGGDIGWISAEAPLPEEIKDKVLALNAPGQTTDVLESPLGFHVFQVVEVKEAGMTPFEEVREKIQGQLLEEAVKREMERTSTELIEKAQAQKVLEVLRLEPYIGTPPPEQAKPTQPAAGQPPAPAPAPPPA